MLLQNMPRQINGGALIEFEFTTTSWLITFNKINTMLLIHFLSSNRHSFGLHPNELAVIDTRFLLRREKLCIVIEVKFIIEVGCPLLFSKITPQSTNFFDCCIGMASSKPGPITYRKSLECNENENEGFKTETDNARDYARWMPKIWQELDDDLRIIYTVPQYFFPLSDLTASSPAIGKQRFVYMETKTKQNK